MPRSISGVYTLPEAAFVAGTVIQSSPVNNDFSDIATALTQSLATTGVSTMTGPIKAAAGSVVAPSITFANALGTGFYLSSTDQMSWAAAGVLAATFLATGAVTWVGAHTFQSSITAVAGTFSGVITGTAGITLSSASVPSIFRNSTNNTAANLIQAYFLGSGAGAGAGIYATGTGANDITQLNWFLGSTEIFRISTSAVRPLKDFTIDGGIMVLATAGYVQMTEASVPSAPAANNLRIYVADDGAGVSRLYQIDSAGSVDPYLIPGTTAEQNAAVSTSVGVTPANQVSHPSAVKAFCTITSLGTLNSNSWRIDSVVNNSAGNYTIVTSVSVPANSPINITRFGTGGAARFMPTIDSAGGNTFIIQWINSAGTPLDTAFSFSIFGLTG